MWPYIWLAWAVIGLTLELWALNDKAKGDTLSEQVWSLVALARKHKVVGLLHIGLIGFFVWLGLHFAFKL